MECFGDLQKPRRGRATGPQKERGVPLLDSTRLRGVFHMRAFSLIFKETEEHNSTALGTTT